MGLYAIKMNIYFCISKYTETLQQSAIYGGEEGNHHVKTVMSGTKNNYHKLKIL